MRALIVEDDAAVSRLLRRKMSLWGWDADECRTVSAAIESFAAGQYDLVLSDVDLPDGSGIALVQELTRRKASLRVIVASGDPRNLERAKEAGFERFLNEPFESDQLRILLEGPEKTGDPRSNVFKPGAASDNPAQFDGPLLLVEDEPVQLEEHRRALESAGFSIVPAAAAFINKPLVIREVCRVLRQIWRKR